MLNQRNQVIVQPIVVLLLLLLFFFLQILVQFYYWVFHFCLKDPNILLNCSNYRPKFNFIDIKNFRMVPENSGQSQKIQVVRTIRWSRHCNHPYIQKSHLKCRFKALFVLGENHFRKCFSGNEAIWLIRKILFSGNWNPLTGKKCLWPWKSFYTSIFPSKYFLKMREREREREHARARGEETFQSVRRSPANSEL